jgi:hypothetical protein
LVSQMAAIINRWGGHDFFEAMLGECEASKRTEMYEALRPYLTFTPLPLDEYISHIKERAGNIESHVEPYQVGNKMYVDAPELVADGVIAKFTCYKCTKQQEFFGNTPVEAAVAARAHGWVRDLVRQKEICPDCPAIYPTQHRTN